MEYKEKYTMTRKFAPPPPPPPETRSAPVLAAALVAVVLAGGINQQAVAQSCEVQVGFENRTAVVFEGNTASLKVTADFKGPISDEYELSVNYSTDSVPKWQGQAHAGLGSDGGAVAPEDYIHNKGTLTFTKNSRSQEITVQVMDDSSIEAGSGMERFYVNLEVPFNADPTSTHRTRDQVCNNPAVHLRRYGFFATVHIRD